VEEMAFFVGQYVDSMPGLVVVWIDELDRCPPEYALGMLRAVRSICDQRGIATVLTVNPDALEEALAAHDAPEIFNTDQGSQFTSFAFTGRLREAGIRISMDGRGRFMDNVRPLTRTDGVRGLSHVVKRGKLTPYWG